MRAALASGGVASTLLGLLASGEMLASTACRGRAEASGAAAVAQANGAATGAAGTTAKPASAPVAVAQVLAIPASWQELPEASHAVEEALAKAKLGGAEVAAWGDPARGCYAIQVKAREEGAQLAQVEAGLRKGFGAPSVAGSSGSSAPSAANAGSAELQLPLAPPLTGVVRARLRDDGVATRLNAAVCFHHARYPEQCRAHCARALASLEAP